MSHGVRPTSADADHSAGGPSASARTHAATPASVASRQASISSEKPSAYGPGSTPASQNSPAPSGGYSSRKSA